MILSNGHRSGGFSLIELVIVIVIIGVISAIAIPRLTRGANNAAAVALRGDLAVLRSAIELYRAEHEGKFPTKSAFTKQMTMYTKIDGTDPNVAVDVATGRIYGPYLRAVPPLPVGVKKGQTGVLDVNAAKIGWIYVETAGTIRANCMDAEVDQDTVKYNTY